MPGEGLCGYVQLVEVGDVTSESSAGADVVKRVLEYPGRKGRAMRVLP
jgi:hypothetical protein